MKKQKISCQINILNLWVDMRKKYEAILFDLDGTLIDSMQINFEAWTMAIKDLGLKYQLKKNWYFENEGKRVHDLAEEFIGTEPFSYDLVSKIIDLKETHFNKMFKFKTYPGVEEILQNVKKMEIKCGMVTAGRQERVTKTIPEKFLRHFDCIITGESTKRGKPSPDPYKIALDILKVQKEKALVVENAPLGIESALAANITCFSVASTLPKEYLKKSNKTFESIKSLNDYIFGNYIR